LDDPITLVIAIGFIPTGMTVTFVNAEPSPPFDDVIVAAPVTAALGLAEAAIPVVAAAAVGEPADVVPVVGVPAVVVPATTEPVAIGVDPAEYAEPVGDAAALDVDVDAPPGEAAATLVVEAEMPVAIGVELVAIGVETILVDDGL